MLFLLLHLLLRPLPFLLSFPVFEPNPSDTGLALSSSRRFLGISYSATSAGEMFTFSNNNGCSSTSQVILSENLERLETAVAKLDVYVHPPPSYQSWVDGIQQPRERTSLCSSPHPSPRRRSLCFPGCSFFATRAPERWREQSMSSITMMDLLLVFTMRWRSSVLSLTAVRSMS